MIINQAFFGGVNNSHSCIYFPITDNELKSFLIGFTDRPGPIPPGVELLPYISGTNYSDYFIFTKTYSDPNSTRLGMVFTHALILSLKDLNALKNLNDIFSLFITEIPKTINKEIIEINELNSFKPTGAEQFPKYIQKTVSLLLKGEVPIVFYQNLNLFETTLSYLWNGMNLELKKRFKFRASFTPSDIEKSENIQMVYVQDGLISRWNDYDIVNSNENELVSLTSYSERFLLGQTTNNSFVDFVQSLKVNILKIEILITAEKAFKIYENLQESNSNLIVQLIRLIGKLSPNANSGKTIKNEIIKKFERLIIKGEHSNIKSLRNLEFGGFKEGKKTIKESMSQYIYSIFQSEELFNSELISEWINLLITEKPTYWHNLVSEALGKCISLKKKVCFENVWKLINENESVQINKIFQFIPNNSDYEQLLIKYQPKELTELSAVTITDISKERKWFLLHAKSIIFYENLSTSLLLQIDLEKEINYSESRGFLYIAETLEDDELIKFTLTSKEQKIIRFLGEKSVSNHQILSKVELSNLTWLEVWAVSLKLTNDIEFGNVVKTIQDADLIFNHIVNGNSVPNIIIELLSKSKYANLYGNKNLETILSNLPVGFRELYIEETLFGYLDILVLNKCFKSLDFKYHSKISSTSFFQKITTRYSDNIGLIILLFENFNSLNEKFLKEFIAQYTYQIRVVEAKRLGVLVKNKGYKNIASLIAFKATNSNNWRYTLFECIHLLSFFMQAKCWVSKKIESAPNNADDWWMNIEDVIVRLYPNLTVITTVWIKSGGEESDLPVSGTPASIWSIILNKLKNSQYDKINISTLLDQMNKDYRGNEEFKLMYDLKDKFINS